MPNSFEQNVLHSTIIESFSEEYLNILAILYGGDIESGTKRLSDFGQMTMLDMQEELHIRTIMLRAHYTRKQRSLREEYAQNERDMMEQLKLTNPG